MRDHISNTAEFGDYTNGPRIITDETRRAMKEILSEIQDGTFARQWISETENGGKRLASLVASWFSWSPTHIVRVIVVKR